MNPRPVPYPTSPADQLVGIRDFTTGTLIN